MGKLAERYPDDVEATILYALAVSGNHDLNDKTFARPLKAAGLLEPLFVSLPQHPGVAHYLIHSYDYPPIAQKGLSRRSATPRSRPAAPHAQHMPSHIFTRVGSWRESIAANQRSVQAAVGDPRYTAHGMDYMVYAYLQLAEDATAAKVFADAGTAVRPEKGKPGSRRRTGSPRCRPGSRSSGAAGPRRARSSCRPTSRTLTGSATRRRSRSKPSRGRSAPREAATRPAARREIERSDQLQRALTERKLGYWAEQTEIQTKVATAWACGRRARTRRRSPRCGRRRTTRIGPRSTW